MCFLQAEVYGVTRGLTYPVPLLDLRVYCLFGYGVDTDEGYLYNVDHFNASAPPAPTRTQQGDGDGTVSSSVYKVSLAALQEQLHSHTCMMQESPRARLDESNSTLTLVFFQPILVSPAAAKSCARAQLL